MDAAHVEGGPAGEIAQRDSGSKVERRRGVPGAPSGLVFVVLAFRVVDGRSTPADRYAAQPGLLRVPLSQQRLLVLRPMYTTPLALSLVLRVLRRVGNADSRLGRGFAAQAQ